MKVEKKDLEKSQHELLVEVSFSHLEKLFERAANKISKGLKIEGFRPGKAPLEVLKAKVGEMAILEEAARIYINNNLEKIFKENIEGQIIGSPDINITKLAPNNAMEFKIKVATLPSIQLGEYKNLGLKQKKSEVDEGEIEKALSELREMSTKEVISEKEVKDSDKVLVDIEMFLDKVPVEGGQGKGTAVIIGKNYVVPGFDKKLIGAKKGDVREFSIKYPDSFHLKNLEGKMVEFRVKVNEVYKRELPELNEQFAKKYNYKNIEDLKKNIKISMEHQKKQEATQSSEREMLDKLIEKAKFGEMPEILVENEADSMLAEFAHNVEQQGGKFEEYLSSIKKTKDQLKMDMLPEAVKRVKVSLLIREIGINENIGVDEKELKTHIEAMLAQYKGNSKIEERLKTPEYKTNAIISLTNRKVITKLREWNIKQDIK